MDGPPDFANQVLHSIQQSSRNTSVLPGQTLKTLRVSNQLPCKIRRRLVHSLLSGQVDSAVGIQGLIPLHQGAAVPFQLRQRVHRIVPVLPVRLRGDLLQPVSDLVHSHHLPGVLGVGGDIDGAVPIPAVGPALAGGGGDSDLGSRGLGQHVVKAGGLLGQAGRVLAGHKSGLVPVHGGVVDPCLLPLEAGRGVVLPGGIGRELLGLGQVGGVVAAHLLLGPAGQPRLIVGGKPGVVPVRVHAPVIGRGDGPLSALPHARGGGGAAHPVCVVHPLGRRPLGLVARIRRSLPRLGVYLPLAGNAARGRPCARHGPNVRFNPAQRRVRVDLCPGELPQQGHRLRAPGDPFRLPAGDLLAAYQQVHCPPGRLWDTVILSGVLNTARGFRRFHARCRVRIDHTPGAFLPGGKPIVVSGRAYHASQAAYGRANQEVIEGVGQGFFCRGHVSAVDPGHLPTQPVRNKFLCALRQGGGPQGEAASHDPLPRGSAGKPLHRRLDSPLDSVVKRAAPIDPGERQRHTEQFFSQCLLCSAGYAVHGRLVPVSSVLHSRSSSG